ncbi:MAG: DUF4236 domain-containing protein [Clostridia bacterium]|nr:DUF4236 domain-containing protein [Clostridia bacterium]
MGFYFRKNFKIGKLVNVSVSKSGVGVSAGVKGFRIGTGPKGNYVSMSKSGIGYKKYFGGSKKKTSSSKSKNGSKTTSKTAVAANQNIDDITTYNTENVVDSSSRELVETIRANRKKLFGKKTELYYDIDEETENKLQRFYDSFEELEDCDQIWYVYGKSKDMANNYHNADSKSLMRKEITIQYGVPKFIKTNVSVPFIQAGDQELFFFPDKVLVVEGKKIGALSYNNLSVVVERGKFKEEGQKPSDAKVVETTYKYTNKDGGPDKRYSYNPKTSIMEYTFLYFLGSRSFSECIMLSKNNVGEKLKFEIENLKRDVNFNENADKSVGSGVNGDPKEIGTDANIEDYEPQEPSVGEENHTSRGEGNMFYKK